VSKKGRKFRASVSAARSGVGSLRPHAAFRRAGWCRITESRAMLAARDPRGRSGVPLRRTSSARRAFGRPQTLTRGGSSLTSASDSDGRAVRSQFRSPAKLLSFSLPRPCSSNRIQYPVLRPQSCAIPTTGRASSRSARGIPSRLRPRALHSNRIRGPIHPRILAPPLATDVANGLLGRVFLGHGSYLLSESRTLS
jgi:hypothetical protein